MRATIRQTKRPRCGARRGITIIETVIALMIFAICIAGFCGIVLQSRQLSDSARDHYTAVNLARSRFERARTFDFDQLHLFVESRTLTDHVGNSDPNGSFRRSTTVSNINPRLIEMTVMVEIKNRRKLAFIGEKDELKMYFADYVERPR